MSIHVESLSLRLKFGSRNGTAASCLCNLLHYIILLCHILDYPLHAGMPPALPVPTLPPPTLFDFVSLVSVYLSDHSPRVTFPCFSVTELHGFLHVSDVCCPIPLFAPPAALQEVSEIDYNTKPADSVAAEYQRSFERRTGASLLCRP